MAVDQDNARPRPRWRNVLDGGLLIALGDMAFATTVWFSWTPHGVASMFRTIAAGLLGPASAHGGMPAAFLGLVAHVTMASSFVLVYTLLAMRIPGLLRRPVAYGAPYGVGLYVVMNFVVMPLSRIGQSPSFAHPDWIAMSVLAHMLFGVTCVVFARRALLASGHRSRVASPAN
jgi:hypothetical protein